MSVNKPLAITNQTFRAMKTNTSKERNFYTQGQQYIGGMLLLLIVCLFTSCNTGKPGGPTEHGEATVPPGASISTPDQAQGGEQQGSKPPLVEQPRSLASNPQIAQQPEKLSELAGGPTEHGEATVRPGASISTPDQAQGGEQQESDPPLVKELRSLASDLEIDQHPGKLVELGNVLLKLAASKQAAGASAQDLSLYTEAAILYQHVLSICEQKADKLDGQEASSLEQLAYQGLAQIEISMLGQATGAGAITPSKPLPARIAEDKEALEKIRRMAKQEAERLASFRDKQGNAEDVRGGEAVYIEGSKKLFADIAGDIKSVLGDFYQAGEQVLGPPPCHYAIMGVGSIALQQTTPYSDLEFAILMEDAPDEDTAETWRAYFRKLTHLVHFRVINLGETVLPFSQYKISLDHLGRKGLNFDLGGKTPLGRKDKDRADKNKGYELIQSVEGMMAYLKNEGNKMEHIDKLLPYILERTCYIHGDQGLHGRYLASQQAFWSSCQDAAGKHAYQDRMRKKLLEGVSELDQSQPGVVRKGREQPGDLRTVGPKLHPEDAGRLYDVKQEIYRLPDRLLYGLAFYYGILPESAWDAVDKLLASNKINEEAARHLKYMVSFAVMLRLDTYLHHGQQNEQLSLRGSLSQGASSGEESSQAAHELLMLPSVALQEDGSLFRYYYTALPLHQQMEEFFEMLNLRQEVRRNTVLDKHLQEVLFSVEGKYAAPQEGAYFQSEPFYDDSCAVKVSVYNRLQQYEAAKQCASEHHKAVQERYFYNTKKLARSSHNLAIACCNADRFDESPGYFTCSLELLEGVYPKGHAEVSYMLKVLRNKGIYHYNRGEYDESRQCFDKSWQLLQAFYNDNHPETAQMLLGLGATYEALGRLEAEGGHQEQSREQLSESLSYKQQSLEMLQSLYPEDHPEVARALLSLGDVYEAMGELAASLDHKEQSLKMFKALCGKSHLEVARALLSLGESKALDGKLAASLEDKQEALAMLQALYGSSHPEVARALLSVGESYAAMGDLAKSKAYKNNAVSMFEVFYKDTHCEVSQARKSLSRTKSAHISSLEGVNPVHTSGPSLPRVRTVHPHPLTLLPTPRHGKEPEGENTLLRTYYSKTDFPYVKSLIFEEQPPKHVKDLECQLMLLEQKLVKQEKEGAGAREDHVAKHHERRFEWVKTRIGSEDLFKKRSIKPGDPEKEIWRILLTGDPGTGKTTVSKKLAYQWAMGAWGQEFHSLYLLPVRSLQQSEYDGKGYDRKKTLSTAIANNCFVKIPEEEGPYNRLRNHIKEELEKSTTLVILDGLDERAGASEEILRQAQAGSHKLLMLSRPYGIETERQRVDIEIEHVGFNDEQMQSCIKDEVSDGNQAAALLGYIHQHGNIREIAHVPVNLQILCALWQDEDYGVDREELEQGSLPGLYRQFIDFTWNRYTKKWGLADENEEEVFDTLGQIALAALEQGEVLIKPGLVTHQVKQVKGGRDTLKARLKDAGFLLLQYVGEDKDKQQGFYEFPHLTFQEYFAGRRLAKQFLSEATEARKFISKHKYESQYGRTLTFMAGEVSRLAGVEGIKKLLSLFEEGDKEIVGLQYLLLQLRVVHEWLCMSGEDTENELAALEDEFHVLSSLEAWFVRAFTHVRLEGYDAGRPGRDLLGLLKSSLQTFGSIAASHAPGLLELFKGAVQGPHGAVRLAAVESLGRALAGAHDEARAMLQTMADDEHESNEIKKPAGAALSQAQGAESTQDETAVGGGTAQGSHGAAEGSASQSPEDLLAQLRQAAKAARNENNDALSSARGSLVQAVAFATEKELGALLAQLLPAAKDCNGLVRVASQEVLWKAPLDALLAHYWSRPDFRLIPYITPRLYHTPLVIGKRTGKGAQQVLLYAAAGQASKCEQPQGVVADFDRHVQDAVSQVSDVDSKLSVRLDKSVWEHYFGSVGEEPAFPADIDIEAILNSPCPFWEGRQVRDTHLLVLIPAQVAGKPLTLDHLGELITRPQAGHGTKYRLYRDAVRQAIGSQSPDSSYWVLMTRDVLSGSRTKSYEDQCALVADHANRTGISYEVPGALEAAVVMLLHHVWSGERLYSNNPDTYTRCRDKDTDGDPVVVGGFSSGGLFVGGVPLSSYDRNIGVSALRKF